MGASYAGILGPLAFVAMLIRGIVHGSSTDSTLISALMCLVAFATVGYILGTIADRTILEAVKQRFDHDMEQQRVEKTSKGAK